MSRYVIEYHASSSEFADEILAMGYITSYTMRDSENSTSGSYVVAQTGNARLKIEETDSIPRFGSTVIEITASLRQLDEWFSEPEKRLLELVRSISGKYPAWKVYFEENGHKLERIGEC